MHFSPALTLSAAITIHLGPLPFCLTAQSLHISLNILQYSNTAHIKSSELPFIYQTSASSHLAGEKKTHLPPLPFYATFAPGISSHLFPFTSWDCQHLELSATSAHRYGKGENVSALTAGFSSYREEARQFDTRFCMSSLIGACFYLCALVCGFRGELLVYSNGAVHVSNYTQPEYTLNCSLSFDFGYLRLLFCSENGLKSVADG